MMLALNNEIGLAVSPIAFLYGFSENKIINCLRLQLCICHARQY